MLSRPEAEARPSRCLAGEPDPRGPQHHPRGRPRGPGPGDRLAPSTARRPRSIAVAAQARGPGCQGTVEEAGRARSPATPSEVPAGGRCPRRRLRGAGGPEVGVPARSGNRERHAGHGPGRSMAPRPRLSPSDAAQAEPARLRAPSTATTQVVPAPATAVMRTRCTVSPIARPWPESARHGREGGRSSTIEMRTAESRSREPRSSHHRAVSARGRRGDHRRRRR